MKTAKDFLYKELGFDREDIKIKSTRLAPSYEASILWIEATEQEIKLIYYKAKKVQNKAINLVTFFPHTIWQLIYIVLYCIYLTCFKTLFTD